MAKTTNNENNELRIMKYGKLFIVKYTSAGNEKRNTFTIKSIEANGEPYHKLHMFLNRQYVSIQKARTDITLKLSELAANGHVIDNKQLIKRDFIHRR